MRKALFFAAAAAVVVLAATALRCRPVAHPKATPAEGDPRRAEVREDAAVPPAAAPNAEARQDEGGGEDAPADEFDALVDKWAVPAEGGVSPDDAALFAWMFGRIPASRRRGESLRRALNLVPDGNAQLLLGLLADKSLDAAVRREVFADVLNRGDALKQSAMRDALADESHPCHDDATWIFKVTGERPGGE